MVGFYVNTLRSIDYEGSMLVVVVLKEFAINDIIRLEKTSIPGILYFGAGCRSSCNNVQL